MDDRLWGGSVLMVAGWQVGADGAQEVFAETEVALENAVAGSGGGTVYCYSESIDNPGFDYYDCGTCKKVCERRGYGNTLQCQAQGGC
jgi:O-acetylhomoserine/O-acetylserine sulfhydrylase-like pyridoxal-dependent enzyme